VTFVLGRATAATPEMSGSYNAERAPSAIDVSPISLSAMSMPALTTSTTCRTPSAPRRVSGTVVWDLLRRCDRHHLSAEPHLPYADSGTIAFTSLLNALKHPVCGKRPGLAGAVGRRSRPTSRTRLLRRSLSAPRCRCVVRPLWRPMVREELCCAGVWERVDGGGRAVSRNIVRLVRGSRGTRAAGRVRGSGRV
jgi:hypothetical protein